MPTHEQRSGIGPSFASAFDEIARARRSVRGFRPDPVPRDLLEHVFAIAGRMAVRDSVSFHD